MNVMEVMEKRYSVRKFEDRPIEDEKLELVLKAGQIAPTAKNLQPVKVLVCRSDEAMNKLRSITRCHYGAPCAFLVCKDLAQEWNNPLEAGVTGGEQDASIITTHMMLEAAELGLGTCWVGMFSPSQAAEVFELPENLVPVCILDIGYPAADAEPSPRHTEKKELSELFEIL